MCAYENIPQELKDLKQWVVCGDDKIPTQCTCPYRASSSNSDTWSTFDNALNSQFGKYIGFVFNNNNIVGIDIDDGYENGLLNELSIDCINHCKSYTEKSKSGRGIHILVKGNIPFNGKNNRKGVEIYKTSRFFVMTGKTIVYKDIIENQPAIDYIINKYFQEEVLQESRVTSKRCFYTVTYPRLENGKIPLEPNYEDIENGGRNNSLLSIGSQFEKVGYNRSFINELLHRVNENHCKPPLPMAEVNNIVKSIFKLKENDYGGE